MPDTAQKSRSNSPKKFLRSFRHTQSSPAQNPPAATFGHSRTDSHDSVASQGSTNWTSLIPPIPESSKSPAATPPPQNRHTIALSPSVSQSAFPDMLQPSADPTQDQAFVLKRHNRSSPPGTPLGSPPPSSGEFVFNSGYPPSPSPGTGAQYVGSDQRKPQATQGFQQSSVHTGHSHQQQYSHRSTNSQPINPATPVQQASKSSSSRQQFHQTHHPSKSSPSNIFHPNKNPADHGDQKAHAKHPSGDFHPGSEFSRSYTSPAFSKPPQTAVPTHPHSASSVPTVKKSQDTHTRSSSSGQNRSQNQRGHQMPQQGVSAHPTPKISNHSEQQPSKSSSKKRKTCNACSEVINGQFIRALNNAYHIDCFKCRQCGVPCSAKFFAHEIQDSEGQTVKVPLCEYDYFKKLDLICFSCDSALRGPYITALGNKYHLEHFKCSACDKVFESDESYYEHQNNIYCHYHYSKLYATKCEGCQSSIVKQFVELFKSGKTQQWHPECYMVYKFWNVTFTADSVGLPSHLMQEGIVSNALSANDLAAVESKIENMVITSWMTLSSFEESSAACISEMLLSACTAKKATGLEVAGKLVLFLEILFSALDKVQVMCLNYKTDRPAINDSKLALVEEGVYSVDAFDKFQSLRKEPRNLSGKLMSYLAILRKSKRLSESGSLSAGLLSVITGCAHYLKLLIRIGLNNALRLNKLRGDTIALDDFLQKIKTFEEVEAVGSLAGDGKTTLNSRLSVPLSATDACKKCSKSIEKSCIRFGDMRWHNKCFECSSCHRKPSNDFLVESYLFGADDSIICTECARSGARSGIGYSSGFTRVSDLSQLIYLLKIAIFRSKSAIKKDSITKTGNDSDASYSQMSNIDEEPLDSEASFSQTLDEVTTLRTKRESQKLYNSVKKNARKSVILEAPEAASAKADNTANEIEGASRSFSTSSARSYSASGQDTDQFNLHANTLRIREDPPSQKANASSLNRTSDLLKNEKSLTLDDIPRIVAAEQAREQRPNAFKHHNSLYQKKTQSIKSVNRPGTETPKKEVQTESGDDKSPQLSNKYFSELTKHEHSVLRYIAVEALLEISNQFSREELLSIVHSKKPNNFWDKFKFGGEKKKPMSVFGTDLKAVTRKYGVDSSLGVGPSQLRIPIVVDDVVQTLRQKDMSVEGIFRLNGNIKNLRELTEQINATPSKSPQFDAYSAVQLAALLKKWLRELPDPLLTFKLYDIWIASRREENPTKAKRILQLAYCMLPRSHRNLLEVLLYFFSWVASFAEIDEESGSKMDTHNLATVIAPNILLSKASASDNGEGQSSDAHFLAIEVVNQLIELHEDLAVIPGDVWEFYKKCQVDSSSTKADDMVSRDTLNKIQKTSKENPKFFSEFVAQENTAPSQQNTIKRGQAKVHGN